MYMTVAFIYWPWLFCRKSIIHLCFKRKQKDTNITEYKSTATEQDSSRSQNDENSYDALQLGSEESDHSYGQVIPSHGPNTYANTRSQAANVDNLYEALKSTGVNNEHPYGDAAKTSSEASHNVEANPYQMLEKQSGSSEHIYRKIETPNKQSKSKISQPGENQSEKGYENLGVYEWELFVHKL